MELPLRCEAVPVVRLFRNIVFGALRDSFSGRPRRNCGWHEKSAQLAKRDARQWFRCMQDVVDADGFGFMYLWKFLRAYGTAPCTAEYFIARMEVLWKRADSDKSVRRKVMRAIAAAVRDDELTLLQEVDDEAQGFD